MPIFEKNANFQSRKGRPEMAGPNRHSDGFARENSVPEIQRAQIIQVERGILKLLEKRSKNQHKLAFVRTSPWNPAENLPYEYARIFKFHNFKKTKKTVLKELDERCATEVDTVFFLR